MLNLERFGGCFEDTTRPEVVMHDPSCGFALWIGKPTHTVTLNHEAETT
jgi:hypothetical protein